jgi:hypothetical protein
MKFNSDSDLQFYERSVAVDHWVVSSSHARGAKLKSRIYSTTIRQHASCWAAPELSSSASYYPSLPEFPYPYPLGYPQFPPQCFRKRSASPAPTADVAGAPLGTGTLLLWSILAGLYDGGSPERTIRVEQAFELAFTLGTV